MHLGAPQHGCALLVEGNGQPVQPETLHPKSYTLHLKRESLDHEPKALNPKP